MKPNSKYGALKQLFHLEFLRNALTLYLREGFQKDFQDLKEFKILKFAEDVNGLNEGF